MKLCAIQDTVAKLFLAPFVEHSSETAARTFKVLITQPGMIQKSPHDFQLFIIGDFDEHTGVISPSDHELVITGKQALETLQAEGK